MNGIDTPQIIYKFLTESTELSKYVDSENIVPLMTPPTEFPFVIYTRQEVMPTYTKDGLAEDTVTVQITVVDEDYVNACKILSVIRTLLEYKSYKDDEIDISMITVRSVYEDYIDDSFVQTLELEIKIRF